MINASQSTLTPLPITPQSSSQEDACAICLDPLARQSEDKTDLVKLSCNHTFHHDCFTETVATRSDYMHCPTCRTKINLNKVLTTPDSKLSFYSRVLEKNEGDRIAHNNYALAIKEKTGKIDRDAFAHLVRAVELAPREAISWLRVANNWLNDRASNTIEIDGVHREMKRIDCYREVVALDPNHTNAKAWIRFLEG